MAGPSGAARGGGSRPPRATSASILLAAFGGFLAMTALALLGPATATTLLLGSFGASCVLLFGYPQVPFAQPANVVGGHLLSALIGVGVLALCGDHAGSLGLAVGLAIAAMMLTRTVHPPAGSNPVIAFLAHADWHFVPFPVLAGALVLVAIALVYHRAVGKTRYPSYW